MENIFINNPITVNVLNINSFSPSTTNNFNKTIKQQIVWINTNDPKIIDMWKSKDKVKLKKHYGESVKNIFDKSKKEGGIEENDLEDDIEENDLENDIEDIDEILFDDNDLDEILKDDSDIVEQKASSDIFNVEKPFIFIKDIYIFPEDKISEFKKKIHIATGIPPYRQHLWYESKKKAFPLSYSIIYDTPLHIDIRDLSKHTNFYEGIPIDTKWYSLKEDLKVIAMDEFQLLDQIYYKNGITEYFIVDLNDFINPIRGNLERLIKKDLYSIELVYYSFIMKYWPQLSLTIFGEYIKNEEILAEKYPDLAPNITLLKDMYKKETDIVGSNYLPELDEKKWDVPLYISITYSIISVTEQYILPGSIVYLRNLFDLFILNDTVNYAICNIEVNGKPVLLTKSYKKTKIHYNKISINAILFNIKIPNQGNVSLIINKKGNYKIESRWREDQFLNFSMIYSQVELYVKPVIEKINTFGKMVSTNSLPVIRNDNSVFTDINISMFWKFNMSKIKFQNVKNLMDKYINAGIMIKSNTVSSLSYDYYFTKGMYKYEINRYKNLNPLQNQYQYLTDSNVKTRHCALITNKKRLSISHRFSDIKIEFKGLKEQEYVTFYLYILRFLESIPRIKGEKQITDVKKLKQLKEKDPTLYEFKKIYDSEKNYSKLCQQQKQPIMYNEPGKNRIEFWNFTTNEKAFYGCSNPNYPYINFLPNLHPKNYCIPCCYKLPPTINGKDKKAISYNQCIKFKVHSNEKPGLDKSRYIGRYGKDIGIGRLCKLPDNSLEPLFFDTLSDETTIDYTQIDDNSTNNLTKNKGSSKDIGYYLFGVPQNIKNVSNIGFLFSSCHAIGKNIIDFISITIDKIKKKKESWYILLKGTITNYFSNIDILIDELQKVFIGDKFSLFEYWNELFIDIVRIYWNIDIVHFIDNSAHKESSNNISIKISGDIQYIEDYKSTNKRIIVIERNKMFYPIYVIYREIFFKMGTIHKTMYNNTDNIIKEIYNMSAYYINKIKNKKDIDLFLVKKFTKNFKYNIVTQFINSFNLCYGITLKYIPDKKVTPFYDKDSNNSQNLNDENYEDLVEEFKKQNKKSKEKIFYIPLKESYYKIDGTSVTFEPPSEKNAPNWKTMSIFIEDLNTFIKNYSYDEFKNTYNKQALLYPLIKIENWLLYEPFGIIKKRKVIGFRCRLYHYLIQPIEEKDATKTHDVKMIKILYNPYDINYALSEKIPPIKDDRFNKIAFSLYENYLYPILIIELVNLMDKQRNTVIRKKIEDIIKNFTIANPQNKDLFDLLEKYPEDYKIIKKMIISNLTDIPNVKKKTVIENFVNKKMFNKKELYEIINNSIFDFDRKLFGRLKKMDFKSLVKELDSIFSNITINKEPKFDDEFPNMIMSCETNHPYCSNKKLMIKKNKLENIISIMAADILNPIKSKFIFSPIFVKNTIDYFKFIIRENENITISI
jgi:hypothetical protein